MSKVAHLYGFKKNNSSHALEELWSKNVFNSTFPVSLALYMRDHGLNAKYIRLRGDLQTEVCEISIDELFKIHGLDPKDVYYDFESKCETYEQFVPQDKPLTDKEKIDLVVRRKSTRLPLSALEIKLTVVPDKATVARPIEEQGAELVCRPVTTKYCALSIFSKLNPDEREAVSNLLGPAYTSINDWNNPDNMDDAQRYLEQLKSAFDTFEQQYYDRQLPLIMQPIWKTEGQSAEIKKDNAFDIFVWSNFAYTRLFLERNFIENKKGKRELTRMARCMIRVAGYLYEAGRVRANRADINGIFAKYTATKQSDKDMSAPAATTIPFMTRNATPNENCLVTPRLPRSVVLDIIKYGGHRKLQPERRLDQSIYFTYNGIKRNR